MRLKLKITGLTQVGDGILVQLQGGPYRHASFSVPTERGPVLHVGQEAVLEITGTGLGDEPEPQKR